MEQTTPEQQAADDQQLAEEQAPPDNRQQLIPALAGFPLAGVYDPASGGELRAKHRRSLASGDPIVILDSQGGYATILDVAGFMWSVELKDVRAYVAVPWIASVMTGSIEFANRLVEQTQKRAAEEAKSKIIVPQGGVPQDVVQEMKEGRRIE